MQANNKAAIEFGGRSVPSKHGNRPPRIALGWRNALDGGGIGQSTGCRSSVVEHSLGKGEVESSIPSGSTI